MSQPVISVAGLGKRYYLRHQERSDTLRDSLTQGVRGLFRRFAAPGGVAPGAEEFWALRNVTFDVQQGDVIGIIGRNGAGKSTLLKILSRITEPTTGRATIRGRVASLLEVGTGFHPELSGRENIYLNGAILGMARTEITRKFDEIVAFAEVERFLDTQVKHYSSGMYVRLAFSVAAHLEPEILIVDEVLAVGDIAFQKKCLGKMESVAAREGRTVLFVSHNLQAVRHLCRTAVLMDGGQVRQQGTVPLVLETYARGMITTVTPQVPRPSRELLDRCYITCVVVETLAGQPSTVFPIGQPWRIRVRFHAAVAQTNFVIAAGLVASDGTPVQTAWHPPQSVLAGDYEMIFEQNRVVLEAGHYTVLVGLSENDRTIQQLEATSIDLVGEGASGYFPITSGVGAVLNSMNSTLTKQ